MKSLYVSVLFVFLSLFGRAQWTDDVSKNVQVAGVNASDIETIGVSGGKTWIAFYSLRNDGNYDMRAQLLDSTGKKLLGDDGVVVSSKPSGTATFVFNICINGKGELIIGYQYEIKGVLNAVLSKVDQQGNVYWGDGVVLGPGLSPYPAKLSTGEIAVAWSNAKTNTIGLQVVSAEGTVADTSSVNVYVGSSRTTRGQVVPNTNGSFTLVFQKSGFGISTTLYAQRYNNSRNALWTAPLQLSNQTTSGARYYSVASESDTTYVGYYSSVGFRFNAFLQRINPDEANALPYGINGSHFSTDTATNDNYQQEVTISQIDSTPTVWAVCTYSDPNQVMYGVYAQRFAKTTGARLFGDKAKRVLDVSANLDRQEGELQLTGNDKAGFIFSDIQNHIYSTKLDNKGNVDSAVGIVLLASTGNVKSRIHFAGNDVLAAAVWSENRGTGDLPYAQNITPAGVTGVLPMMLKSFAGIKASGGIILSWTTLNETSNKGFYIERSVDGRNYSSVGFIASKNNGGNGENAYSYSDNSVSASINYYRLKIVADNGSVSYSETVKITADLSRSLTVSKVFPNPAKDVVYLELESSKDAKLTVFITTANGKIALQKTMTVVTGVNRLPLSVGSLSAGVYFVNIISEDGTKLKSVFTKQ